MRARELVARNVRRVLETRDRKAADLAKQLGWHRQTLYDLDRGTRDIKVDELLTLAFALQVAPAVLLIPWEDDEKLSVELGKVDRPDGPQAKASVTMDSAEAFGWIVGAPEPHLLLLMANPVDYFTTTPVAVQRRHGTGWLKRVREQLGWNVSDDGTVIETPGVSVRRRPVEDDQ